MYSPPSPSLSPAILPPLIISLIPLPRTLPLTVCIILIAHTWADFHIPPLLPLLPRLAHTHPCMCQDTPQTSLIKGTCQSLYHLDQMVVPCKLLLSNPKPPLMQLKVAPPEFICLTGNLDTLTLPTHPGTHYAPGGFHVPSSRRGLRSVAAL